MDDDPKTHHKSLGQVVDCSSWSKFAIVSTNYRGVYVKFWPKVDKAAAKSVKSEATT